MAKSNKARVVSITLETESQNIEITIDEARELYKQLDELFGSKTVVTTQPVYIDRFSRPYWQQYEIICGDDGSFMSVNGDAIKTTFNLDKPALLERPLPGINL